MFSAAYPNPEALDVKFTDAGDGKHRVTVTGTMDGPEGVHRDVHTEAVFSDEKMLFVYHNTSQRLNWNSGWKRDCWYEGDKALANNPLADDAKLEDIECKSVVALLDNNFRGPIFLGPADPKVFTAVVAKTIKEAKTGKLARFTDAQLHGKEPIA